MADRTTLHNQLAAKISTLTESEVAELLDYVRIMETMRLQVDSPHVFEDELVSMVAASDDSPRLRAFEAWSRVRRRARRDADAGAASGYFA